MIKPGTSVECAVKIDEENEYIELRNAMIYDVSEQEIIMSQTTPKLLPSNVGKRIAVTHINHEENVRIGLTAKINMTIKNYKLSSTQRVPAVILTEMSDIKGLNLRFSFRVRPPERSNIKLYSGSNEMLEISDISSGGVRFVSTHLRKYKKVQTIKLNVKLHDKLFPVKAQIIRIEPSQGIGLRKVEFVAVMFLQKTRDFEDALTREVREIERTIRFKQIFS